MFEKTLQKRAKMEISIMFHRALNKVLIQVLPEQWGKLNPTSNIILALSNKAEKAKTQKDRTAAQ